MTRNRHDHDFYRTPALLTRALLSRVQLKGNVLECCSGDGAIAQELEQHRHNLSNLIVFSPRPKFRSDTSGSGSVTVAWFVWRKDWTGETQIEFLNDWR